MPIIPTKAQCYELIERYGMLPHIVRHSELVAAIALLIARKLNRSGCDLDLALIEAGALLHDITKTMSIETKENHAATGGDLLASLGYPAVANIVRQHICLDAMSPDPDVITEVDIVNYADKRVKHVEVVSIEERFQDVYDRYVTKIPHLQVRFEEVRLETQKLEEKIFSRIDITPEQVPDLFPDP